MDKQIRFAPLIRVSTERQEKQGESLKTQRNSWRERLQASTGSFTGGTPGRSMQRLTKRDEF